MATANQNSSDDREYTYEEYLREFLSHPEAQELDDDPKRAASEIVDEILQKLVESQDSLAIKFRNR